VTPADYFCYYSEPHFYFQQWFMQHRLISFLTPRYWPAWLGLSLLWLIIHLPKRWQIFIGKSLGRFLYLFPSQMKHVTKVNLKLCYPEWSDAERKILAKKNFISLGIAMIESARGWWLSDQALKDLYHVRGAHHLEQALQKGKGVILIAPHFLCLELIGRLMGMDFVFGVMYRVHKKPFISYLHARFRKKHYTTYIPSNRVKKLINALQQNLPVWYAYDIDAGSKRSVFAPFFNVPTATLTTVSRIVKLTGASVLPFNYFRSENDLKYEVEISPPLQNFPTHRQEDDAALLNQILENSIRKHPEQYVWQYKRFKTRPRGQKRFYFSTNPNR
jgi:KDO2-lipid IV(A) lauroyltransferase